MNTAGGEFSARPGVPRTIVGIVVAGGVNSGVNDETQTSKSPSLEAIMRGIEKRKASCSGLPLSKLTRSG